MGGSANKIHELSIIQIFCDFVYALAMLRPDIFKFYWTNYCECIGKYIDVFSLF